MPPLDLHEVSSTSATPPTEMSKTETGSHPGSISRAMVLAAGLGLRMRPITNTVPKPLVKVRDKTMLDWALDRLSEAGVDEVVVNLHHLPHLIRDHLSERQDVKITFSDETDQVLETGGGVNKALPLLGSDPFFVVNGDIIWLDGCTPALSRLRAAWDDDALDAVLLVHPLSTAHGYAGYGDFTVDSLGRPKRRVAPELAPFIYAGAQLIHPRLFQGAPGGAFSMNLLWNQAIEQERLACIVHDGEWYHVGTPASWERTERILGLPSSHSNQ